MPEGHTIHRLALDHTRDFQGRRLEVSSPQGRFDGADYLDGDRFAGADAWGKHLFHRWESGHVVHVHLGLFGKFYRHLRKKPAPRETVRMRVVRESDAEVPLLTLDLIGPTACELLEPKDYKKLIQRLGPDPLREDADAELAWKKIQKRKGPIGPVLMDQSVLAGVGNVYRAEALFVHRIHPDRPAHAVTRKEFDALWSWLVKALHKGVRERRIVTVAEEAAHGSKKKNPFAMSRAERLYIYKADKCPSCKGPVRRHEMSGRWSYACDRCQV